VLINPQPADFIGRLFRFPPNSKIPMKPNKALCVSLLLFMSAMIAVAGCSGAPEAKAPPAEVSKTMMQKYEKKK